MALHIRHTEDGGTVFSCSRSGGDPTEALAREIGEEALRQGRCSLCLDRLSAGCGGPGSCQKEPVSDAVAVGILRGMVRG